jgi:hypothetical protein
MFRSYSRAGSFLEIDEQPLNHHPPHTANRVFAPFTAPGRAQASFSGHDVLLLLEQRPQRTQFVFRNPVHRHQQLEARHRHQLGGKSLSAILQLVDHLVETTNDIQ